MALWRCSVSSTPMPEDRHQQHALGGAEVAAVHPGHAAPPATPTRRRASGSPPRASARAATRAEIRGRSTTSTQPSTISTGTIASNALDGSTSSSTAPTTPPTSDADAEPQHPARWPASSRR